jgi:hypothetical protein
MMFKQILAPVGANLALSFLCAALPFSTVLITLGILRRPAWQACLDSMRAIPNQSGPEDCGLTNGRRSFTARRFAAF